MSDINTDKQIKEYTDSSTYRLAQKRQAERVREAFVQDKQHAARKDRDTYLSAADLEMNQEMDKTNGAEKKPSLLAPTRGFGDEKMGSSESKGIIALIGQVLLLQAKCNSNAWKTLWEQASQSMDAQVKFAPIIGDSIKTSFEKQAAQTSLRSTQELWSGGLNLIGAGLAFYQGYKAEEDEPSANVAKSDEFKIDDGTEDEALTNGLKKDANKATEQDQKLAEKQQDKVEKQEQDQAQAATENKTLWQRTKEGAKKAGQKASEKIEDANNLRKRMNGKRATGVIFKAFQAASGVKMMMEGPIGLMSSSYDAQIAEKQKEQGVADAVSKESEQYAQYYSQAFSRSEDLRGGSQQNLDYAMNTLSKASDTITQTTQSMFRG